MAKHLKYVFLFVCCLLFCSLRATAAVTATNLLTLQALSAGTNLSTAYTPTILIQTVPVTLLIQNNGLTQTNALQVNVQLSFDGGSNYQTVTTYWPAITNAAVDSYAPALGSLTFKLRAQVITTNTVTTGIVLVKP